MIRRYPKGAPTQLSKHFHLQEFDCKCTRPECSVTLVSDELVACLEALRERAGAVSIDDAYRCPAHNKEVGGCANSQHELGNAADIKTPIGPAATATAAEQIPSFKNGGIGRYATFTHVDVRGKRARWNG
jgi:zinc D-Ala-D-Ala carboxypeptidase